jgi:mRNA interferase MazF
MSHFAPVAVLPLTTTRRPYPTCVELADALPRTSYVQCEQVRAVSRTRIGPVIGRVDIATMRRIEAVLRRVLGL